MSSKPDSNTIGQRIRAARLEKGKTIAEMSNETGLGATAISNYESGLRIPRDDAKVTIAQYLDKTIEALFFSPE